MAASGGPKARKPKKKMGARVPLRNRELSWLSFNARVLQEASDPGVPLWERLRFLGIFSNNLDEFFRVRVASLRRLATLGAEATRVVGASPRAMLKEIHETALKLTRRFDDVFKDVCDELAQNGIHIIAESELDIAQARFVRSYFHTEVRKHLIPIMLDQVKTLPALREKSSYLAIRLAAKKGARPWKYALVEVPTHVQSRFLQLPSRDDGKYILLLDDVIRFCLDDIFSAFGYHYYEAFAVKITRDAELDLDDDVSQSFVKKMAKSLRQRREGLPVRFTYDARLPKAFFDLLTRKLKLSKEDAYVPGQRYHNFRDFIQFPDLGTREHRFQGLKPLHHPAFVERGRILDVVRERDVLLHHPYHAFDHIMDFLRECAIDPKVTSIRLTIYRAARHSSVINALVNAARNGKSVTVVLELQARFDEEANLDWGQRLQEEGVRVLYGVPGLKVHAKLCLVSRQEKNRKVRYAIVGTGNFNEDTARQYTDHALLTANTKITKEVRKVFRFLESTYEVSQFRHLWVSPFDSRQKLRKLIRNETRNAQAGGEGLIRIKLNNLADPQVSTDLYLASQAGVRVQLIVRSMFSLVPGLAGVSDRVEAIGIVDRYLEHSRIFIFGNNGKPLCFLSSADLMPRNLDRRVEVVCPIYDPALKQELQTFFDIQWQDSVKARILDEELTNRIRVGEGTSRVRAQFEIYKWLEREARAAESETSSVQSGNAQTTPARIPR